uniref:VWFA domain-containing protein n=1 Tax=Plectus sambesii TaxID=2011161 RepID=A0A914UVV5_9BILA
MKCDQQSYSCRLKADRDDIIFMGVDAAAINEDNDGDKDNKQIATKEDSNENQLQIQLVLDVVADDQCTCGDTVHNLWTTFDKANIKSPRGCKKPISCIHYITSKLLFSHVYLSNVPGNINQIKPPNKLIIFDGPSVDYNAVIAGLPCGTNAISMQYSCIWTSQSVISSQQSLTVQLLSDGTNSLNIDLQFQANFAEIPVSSTCGPTNYYLLRPISAVTLNVSLLLEDIHITTCQWNAASYPSRQLGFSVQKLQLSTGSELQVNYFNTTIASCTGSSDQSECNGVSVGNNLTATLRLARFIIPISFQAVILDHLAGARTRQCYADVIFLVESSSLIRNNELLDSVMSMFDQLFLGGGYNRIAVIAYGANMTNNVFLFDSIPYPSLQQYALLNAFLPQPQTSSCSEISLGQGLIAAYDVFLNASFDREKHIVIFSSGCMSSANNPAGVAQIFQTLVNTTIYAVDFSKTSINSNLTLENITANVFHQDDFNEISTLILQSAVSNSCHSIIDAPTTSRPSVTTPITPPPPISCPFNNTQIYSDRITIVLLVEDSQTVQTDFNFLRSDWEAIINLTYTLVPDATWISGYVFAFLNSSSFGVSMNHFNTTAQLISHMNATMPMQSNQSSINLYEAMDTIQQRVASRLLFLILTKNNVTDFSGFHQKAETSIASYGSFAVLMTSAELCAELDRCPFGTIFFSSSGQILMLQAQPNTAAIAASLASFYKQQLLHFHFENNCTSCSTEFAFNIDLGISDVVNIAVYGQFGNSGSISAFASVDSGETTRPLSDVTVYVETSYQRICRIPLNQLYSNESIITISLKLSAGISDRIFATVRGRTKPGFENYIGFSSDAATDFVQSVPGEGKTICVESIVL